MKKGSLLIILTLISYLGLSQTIKNFVTSDSIKLYYQIEGEGEPLFLISMGPGYAPDYLFQVSDSLKSNFKVILLHQRGTGLSKMDSIRTSNMNIERCLQDIDELRIELRYNKISLMGNSFGGLLTMYYSVNYPNRIKSIILVGSAGIDLEFTRYFRANILSRLSIIEVKEIERWSDSIRSNRNVKKANTEMMKVTVPAYFFNKTYAANFCNQITEGTYNHLVSDYLWMDLMKNGYDLKPKFKEFSQNALIIIGRQDIVGESTAYKMNDNIPNSELVIIEECGHLPWIEQPNIFYKEVRDFLKK
ncbi:MAG: alpha/beta hydrolase [Ignavibacteriaceae bacterium]